MLTEFLIYGTVWFWIFAIIIAGIVIFQLENAMLYTDSDDGGGKGATTTIVIAIALYFFLGSDEHIIMFLKSLKDNVLTILMSIIGYFFLGMIWSVIKWYLFLKDMKDDYLRRGVTIGRNSFPKAGSFKSRITSWISYWIFSLTWTLLTKPFKFITKFLIHTFEGVYNSMSERIFADILQEKNEVLKKHE